MREMNKEPLISVIMGVYNDQRFLKEAIESILCQTYKNFELYVMIVLRIKALRY